jgi:hypothetical protein
MKSSVIELTKTTDEEFVTGILQQPLNIFVECPKKSDEAKYLKRIRKFMADQAPYSLLAVSNFSDRAKELQKGGKRARPVKLVQLILDEVVQIIIANCDAPDGSTVDISVGMIA